MKTVIMAGGFGTRISERFPDIPKPLIPIKNSEEIEKPILQWEIESLVSQGYTDIIISVSYMHEKIESYFGDGSRFGCKITFFVEDIPLGNAGALFKLRPILGNHPFFLLNADAIFSIDFNRMLEYHKAKGAAVTIFTHPNSHPYDSGLIIVEPDMSVCRWLSKEDARPKYYRNRVNAGLHILNPDVLDLISINADLIGTKDVNGNTVKVDLDRQILKPLCGTHMMYAYDSPEYVKDMGTPSRFDQVCFDYQTGVVDSKKLTYPQRAIFLDRDGTINRYVGFLRDIDDFELIPGVAEAIKLINSSGYLAIVVTNQPVIARGEVTVNELNQIHNKMETLLGAEGAYLDDIFYCPHHPHSGYNGEIIELKTECNCRKPKPGMLIKASMEYNIDLNKSWMIGDGENDVKCGQAAGCKTALISACVDGIVERVDEKLDYGQCFTASSLFSAVKKILFD